MTGFQHAGVTKGMMIVLGLTTLSASLLDVKPYLHLQLVPHITKYYQIWRIAIHPFAFANSTELLLGELLLYNAGASVERAFGSRKYASFILVSSLLSTLLASVLIVLFHSVGLNSIPAGPYGVIFSLLWQQYRIFPSLYHFRVLGIEFSSKAFGWIMASLLIFSNPPSSILISLCGIAAGFIYRTDTLFPLPSLSISRRRLLTRRPLKSYRIPLSLQLLLARLFSPLAEGSHAPRRSQRVLPGQSGTSTTTATAISTGLGGGAGRGGGGTTRPTLRSLLSSRLAADPTTTGGGANAAAATAAAAAGTPNRGGRRGNIGLGVQTGPAASPVQGPGQAHGLTGVSDLDDREQMTSRSEDAREPGSATAAMGEWVSEMTGRGGARAPTEEEIGALSSMFPNLGRDTIVRALQRSDYNTAQAVEALLEESG
ncbi:hypothetical protein IAU59_005727 [Kwoniella sp. CBS 9459]